jgi:phage shock protein PspC (stress-responsive transcriptional regulator)
VAETKKLYRLPERGKLFGVAAGLADYFDFDVTLVRIILVVMVVAGAGFVIPVYLVLALLLPTPDQKINNSGNMAENVKDNLESITHDLREGSSGDRARNLLGGGLVVLGLWLLAVRVAPEIFRLRWEYVWPVVLVLLGLLVLTRMGRRK